jgi:hypothetical protein
LPRAFVHTLQSEPVPEIAPPLPHLPPDLARDSGHEYPPVFVGSRDQSWRGHDMSRPEWRSFNAACL